MKNLDRTLSNIKGTDVCELLRKKFEAEGMNRFFDIDNNFSFKGNDVVLTPENSMLLRFGGHQTNHSYNLLLIFSLSDIESFNSSIQIQIKRISEERNIDKIVIWTRKQFTPNIIHMLKAINVNLIHISNREFSNVKYISKFFPYGDDYNYSVVINKLTDLLVLRLKKLFHLVLSEIAADSYDEEYATNKYGTKAVMDYEEYILSKAVDHIKWFSDENQAEPSIAIDVGCGTGRHSLGILRNNFDKVFGFDFSPRMINVANRKKRGSGFTNVIFSVADLEYEEVAYEEEFTGKSDIVVASFGMGSFIEDTEKMLRRFYEWLKPGGILFLSMYNRNSILLNLTPNWRDTSLSAHIDVDTHTLRVQLNATTVFHIYCKPFDNSIKSAIARKFDIKSIYSYPTTLAILPNSLLEDNLARELFTHIDLLLANDSKFFLGHYVLLIAQKPSNIEPITHNNVLKMLKDKNIKYELIKHNMVLSVDDVINELGNLDGIFVKTLIFYDIQNQMYHIVALEHKNKLRKEKFAKYLNVPSKKLKFATEKQISELGFSIGGIPPFGYPTMDNIHYYIDESLLNTNNDYIYTGVGDNRMTLKLRHGEFIKLINEYDIIANSYLYNK